MAQTQSGITDVGKSAEKSKRVTVTFGTAFTKAPVLVANTLQDPNYPIPDLTDTFAVSVRKTTTTEADIQVYRVDRPDVDGWDQDLQLGWIAIG